MAAGSSSPELFAELVGVVSEENSAGTGTVVGSAIFNQSSSVGAVALPHFAIELSIMPLIWTSAFIS